MDNKVKKLMEIYNQLFPNENFHQTVINKDLEKLLASCEEAKKTILMKESFNSYHQNANYIKLFLMEKILKEILKEIKPPRTKFNKKTVSKMRKYYEQKKS